MTILLDDNEKKQKFNRIIIYNLILVCIFYVAFLVYDIITLEPFSQVSRILKFAALLLLSGNIGVVIYNPINKFDAVLLTTAFILTILADGFMTLSYYPILGFILFIIIQVVYIIRHTGLKVPSKRVVLIAVIPVLITICGVFILYINVLSLRILTSLYAGVLTASLIAAWYAIINRTLPIYNGRLAAIGMSLFFLCDLSLGVYTAVQLPIIGILVWLFYLPGQYLLTLSGVDRQRLSL